MDELAWDERYAAAELVWSAEPNRWVVEVAEPLPPGRVLDLAGGEGRNALWLAERGWQATVVDFSAVALDRARALAEQRLDDPARLSVVHADLDRYRPAGEFDLVLIVYLQLPEPLRTPILRRAAEAVAPGGRLLVAAHHSDNLTQGSGGPPDPAVLYTQDDVAADLAPTGLSLERCERVLRPVPGARDAVDLLVVAAR